jgi:hypothetical protein
MLVGLAFVLAGMIAGARHVRRALHSVRAMQATLNKLAEARTRELVQVLELSAELERQVRTLIRYHGLSVNGDGVHDDEVAAR